MTDPVAASDIWSRLDELSDVELATLVQAAEHVIADSSDDEAAAAYLQMPMTPLGDEIADSLRETGAVTEGDEVAAILRDEKRSRELALRTLKAISGEPALAQEVAETYAARRDMMVLDAGILAAGALVLLVIKLKRIKVGKVDVTFYEARADLLQALRSFLGR